MALGKVDEVGKYLQDLISILSDDTAKESLNAFCKGDSTSQFRENYISQKTQERDKKARKSLNFESLLVQEDTMRFSLSKDGSVSEISELDEKPVLSDQSREGSIDEGHPESFSF